MKKGKIIGAFFLIAALIIMGLPVPSLGAKEESSFKIESDVLKSYVGTEKTVSVPDGVETIGRDAFKDNLTVEKVILPASVTKIEPYAFWGCENLKEISLGSKIKDIGDYAFANCSGLEKMTLPSGTRSIGIYSFEDCINMTDITIPYTVTDIHETSFDGCKRLVIHAEAGSYPDKYAQAFYLRQREMAEYEDVSGYDTTNTPTGTTNTPVYEEENQDTSDSLLGSVHVVQNSAVVFIDNSSFTVYEGMPNTENKTEPTNEHGFADLSSEQIGGSIPKVSIVDGKIVADQAYYRNDTLTTIHIPDSIVEVGEFSFARSSLTEVSFGSSVETIGYGAFYHCDNLKQVYLSDSVMNVAPKAFEQTKWVKDFLTGNSNSDFLISGGVLVAYNGDSSAVDIPEGVRVIAAGCFADHTEIGSVRFPESLLVIGEEAFYNCSSLSNVLYGGHEMAIKDRAFAGTAISSTQLPNALMELGLNAFSQGVRVSKADTVKDTVEDSARRLSNYAYRGTGTLGKGSVSVSGLPGVLADLSGAKESYTLFFTSCSTDAFAIPFQRNLSSAVPDGAVAYEMVLTDQSGIAIDKLGKQSLNVVIPASFDLANRKLSAVILDRNGQLERVAVKKVQDGTDVYLSVDVNYVSKICIYPVIDDASDALTESSEEIMQLSSLPKYAENRTAVAEESTSQVPWQKIKWFAGGLTFLLGAIFILKKS